MKVLRAFLVSNDRETLNGPLIVIRYSPVRLGKDVVTIKVYSLDTFRVSFGRINIGFVDNKDPDCFTKSICRVV